MYRGMYTRVPPLELPASETAVEDSGNKKDEKRQKTTADKPKHVSLQLWEKFKALEKRTDEATKRSTEKRVKELKQHIVETVEKEISCDEDRDILRAHDVKFGLSVSQTKSRKNKTQVREADTSKEINIINNEKWKDVSQYLDTNKHLEAGVSKPQTKLNSRIEEALAKGDYSTAEKLSDQLANRELGAKIANAFDARDFVKRKKEEEDECRSKKKKKLNWGFEHKQRWEMKSNM